jgi:hypothetical protein
MTHLLGADYTIVSGLWQWHLSLQPLQSEQIRESNCCLALSLEKCYNYVVYLSCCERSAELMYAEHGLKFKSIEIVKELMEKTTTSKGLQVTVQILDQVYETGRKAADDFEETMRVVFAKRPSYVILDPQGEGK